MIDNFEKNIVLVGLGPHAKRIYMNLFKKYNMFPKLIIDLDINEHDIMKYLSDNDFHNIKLFLIPSKYRDSKHLPIAIESDLKKIISELKIEYSIISTEPKAHLMYSEFFIKNNINILMDKPITAPKNVFTISGANMIENEYKYLCDLYLKNKDNINFIIQCQRRFHIGYQFVKNVINETICDYKIPITYIDIYHSDGMWNMPDEFFTRENHPYKYGYGKLFHSGYHFVDLLTWFIECNSTISDKKIDSVSLYSSIYKPSDFFYNIDNNFYKSCFNTNKFFEILKKPNLTIKFGELDFHSMMDFKSQNNIVTHCSFNLLQSGFSKRAWTELPNDIYKSNGRVRHERINIQIGPIMNIQIHSYQAFEINEKIDFDNYGIGGKDHFDIYIFRNSNLIGGKAFEKISIKDLINKENDSFLGNNEKAREICFCSFFNNDVNNSNLLAHQKSILLLSNMCKSIASKSKVKEFKWSDFYE